MAHHDEDDDAIQGDHVVSVPLCKRWVKQGNYQQRKMKYKQRDIGDDLHPAWAPNIVRL